ncbi:ribosome silencing factor [Desulfonatronovibrio hydrogenovorans]|uniref:ribosome silencing factor n=1 Tax=Desulfonatronovibrio hydrogenovorans TaxID=53245 RepID=UPI00048CB5A4|nr:ribosome silencing factor [Desulfonatronovibrio hydrogenovorans]
MNHTKQGRNELNEKLTFLGSLLLEKKASNVLALDVSIYSGAFEGMILASAGGNRHARSLADHVLEAVKENQLDYLGMEGYQEGEWILLDLNDIIIHIFLDETRLFYNLEGFWTRGREIPLKATGGEHA